MDFPGFQYVKDEELGRGSFGTVHRYLDMRLNSSNKYIPVQYTVSFANRN